MHERFAAVKTGIVVLTAGLVLLGLIYFATGGIWFRQWSYYQMQVEPGPLAPRVGDPISINGIEGGKVEKVYFESQPIAPEDARAPDEEQETFVMVSARIDSAYKLPLGTKGLISESITGQRDLKILLGRSKATLDAASTLEQPIRVDQAPDMTSIATRFEEVGTQAKSLVTKVESVADNANVFIDTARETMEAIKQRIEKGDIDQTLSNIAEASENIKSITAQVDTSIGPITEDLKAAASDVRSLAASGAKLGEELPPKIDAVLGDVKGITGKLDGIVTRASPKIDGFLDDVGTVGDNIVKLSEELAEAGPEVREVLRSAGRDVDELLEVFKDTAYNLADASEDIRAHPWKLLNEPEADEIAYENLRTTMQNYVRAMQRVDRATETVRQALALDPKSPGTSGLLRRALATLDGSLDQYKSVEGALLELLRDSRPTPAAAARVAPPPRVRPN